MTTRLLPASLRLIAAWVPEEPPPIIATSRVMMSLGLKAEEGYLEGIERTVDTKREATRPAEGREERIFGSAEASS
jgi:hypothetical protein